MGRIQVRVVPRGSRNAIEGYDAAGRLRVRLTAPPVEGAANAALIEILAGALGLARSRLAVVRGRSGRTKTIEVEGWSDEALRSAFPSEEEADRA